MELNEILSRFKGVKKVAPNRYECRCPAHDDVHPSMALYVNKGEWIQPKCFAGCPTEAILDAVGLKKSDLYIGNRPYNSKPAKTTSYEYKRTDGSLAYEKKRFDHDDGTKTFQFCLPDGRTGLNGASHIPYNLPGIATATTIYFVEGEKCADAVIEQGYVATTLDCGASGSKMSEEDIRHFVNKDVIILPDNDEAGMNYARRVKQYLPWAVVKLLPGLKEKGDIYDWLHSGHTMKEVELLSETPINGTVDEPLISCFDRRPQSEILLELIGKSGIELFLNENNDPYAEIPIDDHKERYPLDSKEFHLWAQRLFHKSTKKAIRKEGLTQAVAVLEADTKFGGKASVCQLSNRVAEHDGCFWYDLTDREWQAVKVTPTGWEVVSDVPRLFCRYRHQNPQVLPRSGGNLEDIFKVINLSSSYRILFLCWLVSCFVPEIPHPMPIFTGEKGAAKSTTCTLTKRLIDPSVMDTLSLGKDERTLVVNLQQTYFLPFDNVSTMTSEVSDTLCRAITGGAIQQRKLYTNGEDYIFKFRRCIALNGINNVASRADLLDRSIIFELERVTESKRRELTAVVNEFEKDRPYLLGAVFDVLSEAMRIYPAVELTGLTRMADFCHWGFAIGEALGGYGDKFLNEYKANQALQNVEAINADAVAYLVVEFMRDKEQWRGRVSSLFSEIQTQAESHGIGVRNKGLPQAPNSLSRRLKAIRSNLERIGISFELSSGYSDGTYVSLVNHNFAPLSPYFVNPGEILGKSNGDTNGDGDGRILPPEAALPEHQADMTDYGGDGDNSEDIVF